MFVRDGQSDKSGYFSFPAIAGQNPWLDVLRAVAVLMVLLRHGERAWLQAAGGDLAEPGWASALALNGWVGVDLFLVLSGYLISRGLLRRMKGGQINVVPYFRNRILRIVPAYYAVLFVTAAGLFPLYRVSDTNLGVRVVYHMLFLQDYLAADINVVFWSLGVEEKFYILAPLLFMAIAWLGSWRRVAVLLCALWLVSPLFKFAAFGAVDGGIDYAAFFKTLRSPFHMSLEPLIVGVAVGTGTQLTGWSLSRRASARLLAASAVAGGVWMASHEWMAEITAFDAVVQPALVSILFGIMVLSAHGLMGARVVGEAAWRATSRLSYALYLVHFPLLGLSVALAGQMLPGSARMFWAVFLALSVAGALLLHFAVEKPFLRLKDSWRPVRTPSKEAAHVA